MGTLQRAGAGLLALTLFAGLAACGDDGDGDEGAETTADGGSGGDGEQAAGNQAFCDAVAEFNAVVFTVDVDEESTEEEAKAAGEELAPLFQTVADEAPDSLSASAEDLNETVQALTEGDASGFASDDTFQQYSELIGNAVDECEFDTVDVTAIDYAYQGVPETIPAGTTAFSFTNAAESEDHMMGIVRKTDGTTETFAELLELPEEQSEGKVEFKGDAFASAGDSSSALAELDPGEYAMVCFISVGSPEVEDGPPHFTKGMIQEFTVE